MPARFDFKQFKSLICIHNKITSLCLQKVEVSNWKQNHKISKKDLYYIENDAKELRWVWNNNKIRKQKSELLRKRFLFLSVMRITPFGIEQFLPVRDQKTKLERNLKLLIWEIHNCTVKTIFTSEELLFKWWTTLPVSLNKIKELHPTGRITRDTPSLTGKFAKLYKIPLTKWFFCFHVYFANYYGESGKIGNPR